MRLWRSLLGRGASSDGEQRHLHPWNQFSYQGVSYQVMGRPIGGRETAGNNFPAYVRHLYQDNGVVFACMAARQLIFSEARLLFQEMNQGQPGDLFGSSELRILENPWQGATTGDLLSRMLQDIDLAGNAYVVKDRGRLRRLRPDWVQAILSAPPEEAVESDVIGYRYTPGGCEDTNSRSVTYAPEQVAHWAPYPDPEAQYRGMSWLTPVLREIESDTSATVHKQRFFDNAATPNLAVSFSENVTKEQFDEFMESMNASHQGAGNAYKTLYLGGGADVKVLGSDLQQLDFRVTQGAGETRVAAAARVHPVIVGLSEGLQGSSLNAGNFNSARRLFADGTLRPLWRGVASALERLVNTPQAARLWYDERDIAFLREDRADVAKIQANQAGAIRQLTEAGYEPETIVSAIQSDNFSLLQHTGVYSVQLQPPATGQMDGDNQPVDDQTSENGESDADGEGQE